MRPSFRAPLVIGVVLAVLLTGADLAPASDIASPTLTVRSSSFGRILFSGKNRALYAFTRDSRATPTCYGECAVAWPPYIVNKPLRAGAGTTRALYGTARRRDGRLQLTYAGKPLYFYAHDPVGQVLCQNVPEFGGLWLVVRPDGRVVR